MNALSRFCAILAIALVVLSMPASAAEIEGKLTGEEIKAKVVGNTFTGTSAKGFRYTEYLSPNGRIKGGEYFGYWSIRDDKLCLDYDPTNDSDGCWAVALVGDTLSWLEDGKVLSTSKLLQGNPKGL